MHKIIESYFGKFSNRFILFIKTNDLTTFLIKFVRWIIRKTRSRFFNNSKRMSQEQMLRDNEKS